MTKRFNHFRRF